MTLYLPRSKEAVEPSPTDNSDTEASPRVGEGEIILLVEDNLEVADVTRGLLEELGYVVVCALDAPSARAVLRERKERVHLVLTDIVMPEVRMASISPAEFGRSTVDLSPSFLRPATANTRRRPPMRDLRF